MNTPRIQPVRNNGHQDRCAWRDHGEPAQFEVINTHGDNWAACSTHVAALLHLQADNAPLVVQPIFGNWTGRTLTENTEEVL